MQVQAARSSAETVDIGLPQGGPMSPVLWREFSNDIPACITYDCKTWKSGEEEDDNLLRHCDSPEAETTSYVTKFLLETADDERSDDKDWDLYLSRTENKIEEWRKEKTDVGPERSLVNI